MEYFVESFQMNWGGFFWEGSDFYIWSSYIYQYGRKFLYIQFFGGQVVFFIFGVVVEFIFFQFFFCGEGLQIRVQVDGFCLFSSVIFYIVMVFIKLLQGIKLMYFVIFLFNMYIYIIIIVFIFLVYIIFFSLI